MSRVIPSPSPGHSPADPQPAGHEIRPPAAILLRARSVVEDGALGGGGAPPPGPGPANPVGSMPRQQGVRSGIRHADHARWEGKISTLLGASHREFWRPLAAVARRLVDQGLAPAGAWHWPDRSWWRHAPARRRLQPGARAAEVRRRSPHPVGGLKRRADGPLWRQAKAGRESGLPEPSAQR